MKYGKLVLFCSLSVLGVFAVSQASAATNMVVLNSSSKPATVTCNAVGTINPGEATWSCIDADITANGMEYQVKDTGESCGSSAWNIEYIANGKVIKTECTHIGFGRTGCHYVQILDNAIKVKVMGNENLCASQWGSQVGAPAVKEITNLLLDVAAVAIPVK